MARSTLRLEIEANRCDPGVLAENQLHSLLRCLGND